MAHVQYHVKDQQVLEFQYRPWLRVLFHLALVQLGLQYALHLMNAQTLYAEQQDMLDEHQKVALFVLIFEKLDYQ